MPNRYSHYAMEVEATVRAKLIIQVRKALVGLPRKAVADFKWPELLTRSPSKAEASELVAKWKGDHAFTKYSASKPVVMPRALATAPASSSDSSDSESSHGGSSSSGSSSYSSSADGEAANTVPQLVDPALLEEAQRLLTCELTDYQNEIQKHHTSKTELSCKSRSGNAGPGDGLDN